MVNFRTFIAVVLVFILNTPAQSQIGFGPLYEKETIKLKSKKLSNFKILYHNGKAVVLSPEQSRGIRISSTNAFKENLGYANALVKVASSDDASNDMFDALSTFENERALSSIKRSRVSNQQKEFKKREALAEIRKKGDLDQLKRVGVNIKGNLAYATYKFFPDYDFDRGVFVFSVSANLKNLIKVDNLAAISGT